MPGPIATVTDSNVSCGTMLWRYKQRLQLTVVVKASFTLTPGGATTHAGPGEVLEEERTFGGHPMRSVELASDRVPHRTRCDVTFVGHAYTPGGVPTAASAARLGLSRDGRPLLDKVIHVFGDRVTGSSSPSLFARMPLVYERAAGGPGEINPFGTASPNLVDPADPRRPACFAPISRFWPARKRLLEKIDPRSLEGPIAEIPDTMPWGYFQAAPADQQIDPPKGGEWLVLDGVHPTVPRIQARLPSARGAARMLVVRPGVPLAEHPVELACDTVAIDGERWMLSLVWRGRYEVPGGEAALPSLYVAAALEAPGAAVSWESIASQVLSLSTPAARVAYGSSLAMADTVALRHDPSPADGTLVPPHEPPADVTLALRPEHEILGSERAPRAPFALAPAGASAGSSSTDATPWGVHTPRPVPLSAPVDMTLGPGAVTPHETVEGTLALRPEQQTASAQRPVAPFAIGPSPGGTHGAAALPGAPWSGAPAPAALPLPAFGEETLALGTAPIGAPPISPPEIQPPPMLAPLSEPRPPAPPSVESAPAAAPVPPSPAAIPARDAARPPPPAPRAPRRPEDAREAPRAPEKGKGTGLPTTPEALAEKLRAAGASSDNVAALLRALKPPPPPPADDD